MPTNTNQDLRNRQRRSLYYSIYVLQKVMQLAKSVSARWLSKSSKKRILELLKA
ncbi:hypothetical protein IQ231_16830 [Cuspidothrix issatschenkoi LEGE 03284]|uniref:hypothetical protein n=1 Tax=Cuspidothrix issatschenkoi TaxID=230752 RepID=UPI0019F7708D|nr:hypothetical protein [Cuspidothrix issatschenkoi]MBE9233288.1 hypothetical protein [Cuspidothrix issatschenkoi LEGE 03284]